MAWESQSGGSEPALTGLFPGSFVAGYRLESLIGAGGMGVVFRAYDEALSRTVALKVLAPALAGNAEFRERFIRKSRAVGALVHPHVIPVFDAGEADGVPYLAMRFVAGGDLRAVLGREGMLTGDRVIALLSPVASALDTAHADGLVHSDVKPANILVEVRPGHPEHPYLSDFGLVSGAFAAAVLTGTGQFAGTPDYVAPEQISGEPARPQTDQYSLACVAYALLAGTPPFTRDDSAAVLSAHQHDAPPSLAAQRPGLPPAVDEAFARALAKSPEDRYGTCGELIDALRAALASSPALQAETLTALPPQAETVTALSPQAVTVTALSQHAPSVVAEPAGGPGIEDELPVATMTIQGRPDGARDFGLTTAGDGPGGYAAVAEPSAAGTQPAQARPRRRRRGLIITTAAAAAVVVGAGVLIGVHPWAHPPVLKPVGLIVRSDTMAASGTADTMELAWSGPATGPLPDDYEVFRGGRQVATVRGTETRYTDQGLAPNAAYGFQVIAVRGGKQSPASATLTVHTPPLQPTGLTAKGATTSSMVISWQGPAAGPPPGQYEILRDGAKDTIVPGSTTTYTDTGLAPDTAYSYQVIALTGSERSPASAALSSPRTTKPPLSAAVLNWTGTVTETATEIDPPWPGFKTQPGSSTKDDWTITPNCSSGPCNATINGTADAWDITAKLTRSGTTYSGTATLANGAFYCATQSQTSGGSVTITITVKSAATQSGVWTATSFSGTESIYSPAAYSCESNTVYFSVKSS
jgi:serine/threonine-protein kinase